MTPTVQFATITAEASQAHSATLRSRGAELGADVRVRLEIGDLIFAADYIKAQRIRAKMRMEFSEVLHDRDAIVMPTILATAPALTDTLVEASGQQFPMHAAMTSSPRHTTQSECPQLLFRVAQRQTALRQLSSWPDRQEAIMPS